MGEHEIDPLHISCGYDAFCHTAWVIFSLTSASTACLNSSKANGLRFVQVWKEVLGWRVKWFDNGRWQEAGNGCVVCWIWSEVSVISRGRRTSGQGYTQHTGGSGFCFVDILGICFGFFLGFKVIVLDYNYGENQESIIENVSQIEEGKMSALSFQVHVLHAL